MYTLSVRRLVIIEAGILVIVGMMKCLAILEKDWL